MSSKDWVEKTIAKPGNKQDKAAPEPTADKRERFIEMLRQAGKKKG